MRIEILGTGCHDCRKLKCLVHEVLQTLNVTDVEVVSIDDRQHIERYIPVDAIPGLVADGQLLSVYQLPYRKNLLFLLSKMLGREGAVSR